VHSKTTESLSIKNPNYAGNGSIPIVVKNYICQAGYGAKGEMLALAIACLFYGLLAGSLFLVGYRLARFTVYVFLLGMVCVCFGALVRKANNSTAAVIFSATFSGWIIAVSFFRY
jgi:hypothetical protein